MDRLEYRIGQFRLKPFRQLLDGAAPVAIGRKALDLLSVLAKAEGELVTKDELMAAVWPKAIVEDNAIQVHVAALRKALGKDAGLLATVRGLGYRLEAGSGPPPPQMAPQAPPQTPPGAPATEAAAAAAKIAPPWRRVTPMVSTGFSLVALAAVSLWPARGHLPWEAQPRPTQARFAVLPFEIPAADPGARALADGLGDKIIGELSDNQMQAISRTQAQALRGANAAQAMDRLGANLLLEGAVRRDGETLDVDLKLEDAREHVVVWSHRFEGPAKAPEALQADIAARAAEVGEWAKVGLTGKVKLDATGLAAYIAGRESTIGVRSAGNAAALSYYRKVVAVSPAFSWGHSGVAAEDAFSALDASPPEKDALIQDARREASQALALDPHNGEAYLALELVLPLHDWQRREARLLQGAAADPGFEPVALMEGRLLWVVGRGHDALPWLQRAHDLDPLHNGATWTLALSLASEGRPADSRATVRRMEAGWPDGGPTRDARFWTAVLTKASSDTLALLADPALRPGGMTQRSVEAWRAAIAASASHDRKAQADAARSVVAAADGGALGHGQALTLLAMLGDLDDAFAQARSYEPLDPYTAPYLFLPATAPLRADPRFIPLADRLGLVAYWRATGRWPDFCSEPGLPYDCRREAARVATSPPPGSNPSSR